MWTLLLYSLKLLYCIVLNTIQYSICIEITVFLNIWWSSLPICYWRVSYRAGESREMTFYLRSESSLNNEENLLSRTSQKARGRWFQVWLNQQCNNIRGEIHSDLSAVILRCPLLPSLLQDGCGCSGHHSNMAKGVGSVAKPGFRSHRYLILGKLLNLSVIWDGNSLLPLR